MPVIYKKTSPYFNTRQRNIFIEYLDFYVNRPVSSDSTDDLIAIPASAHLRPDLLSAELYGTPDLWWTFAVRNPNKIIDPIYDFITGKEIFVPTRERMLTTILG